MMETETYIAENGGFQYIFSWMETFENGPLSYYFGRSFTTTRADAMRNWQEKR